LRDGGRMPPSGDGLLGSCAASSVNAGVMAVGL
jgi:hypothetical protein